MIENHKRWLALSLGLLLLLLGPLAAWPLFGLKRIADRVHARDEPGFMALVNRNELTRSLAAQIAGAYLKSTIANKRLHPFALNLASKTAIAAADMFVAEMVYAGRLFDLLIPTHVETFAAAHISSPKWGPPNLRSAGKLFANAEYRGRNFYLSIPLSAQAREQYRVRLKLTAWKWKLAGIDLPEAVRQGLTQEFAKRFAR